MSVITVAPGEATDHRWADRRGGRLTMIFSVVGRCRPARLVARRLSV